MTLVNSTNLATSYTMDDLPAHFDPAADAYNDPNFNSYSSGLGAEFSAYSANGVAKNVELYVSKIPRTMGMESLENLFSQYATPLNIRLHTSKNTKTISAFVEFAKISEAEMMIKKLNNQPPFHLTVEVAKEKAQSFKGTPIKNTNDVGNIVATQQPVTYQQPSMLVPFPYPMASGRGSDIHPIAEAIQGTAGLPFMNAHWWQLLFNNSNPESIMPLGRIYERYTNLPNNRRVSGGRVYTVPPPEQVIYRIKEIPEEINEIIGADMEALSYTREKSFFSSGVEPSVPPDFKKFTCEACGVLTTFNCKVCKRVAYCSPDCQIKDWPQHKLSCRSKTSDTKNIVTNKSRSPSVSAPVQEVGLNKISVLESCNEMQKSFSSEIQQKKGPPISNMYARPSGKKPQHGKTFGNDFNGFNSDNNKKGGEERVRFQNQNESFSTNELKKPFSNQSISSAVSAQEPTELKATENAIKTDNDEQFKAGDVAKVSINFSTSWSDFWVCKSDDLVSLDQLMLDLNKRLKDSAPGFVRAAQPGDWCCVKYEGVWTRARVTTAQPLTVFYVDYGNSETVTADQLKVLPSDLAAIRPFAINVSYPKGLPEQEEVFTLRFLSKDATGRWTVEPADQISNQVKEGVSTLVTSEQKSSDVKAVANHQPDASKVGVSPLKASVPDANTPAAVPTPKVTRQPFFTVGQVVKVIATHPLNNSAFYVNKLDCVQALDKMQSDLNDVITHSSPQLESVIEKSKCAAIFETCWYRGKVLSVEPLRVRYVDYGNDDVCKPADVKELPEQFTSIMPFAALVHSTTPLGAADLKALTTGLDVRVVGKEVGKWWLVEVINNQQSSGNEGQSHKDNILSPEKTERKECLPPNDPSIITTITKNMSSCRPESNPALSLLPDTSKNESSCFKNIVEHGRENEIAFVEIRRILNNQFFVCTVGCEQFSKEALEVLGMDLGNPSESSYQPEINEMVAVYVENCVLAWQRGIVLSEAGGYYSVALPDTGCVIVSKHLRKLPQEMLACPLLAVKLCLKSCSPIDLKEVSVLRVELAKRLSDANGWEVKVEHFEEQKKPFQLGVGKLLAWKKEADDVDPLVGVCLKSGDTVIISSFHDVHSIYVRPINPKYIELYECLSQEVAAECYKAPPLDREPFVGELLAAKWSADGNFYRAQILGKEPAEKHSFNVLFVDYGNRETIKTSEMKLLSSKLKNEACCAVKVGLKGVNERIMTPAVCDYGIKLADSEEILLIEFEQFDAVQLTKKSDNTNINKEMNALMEPSWIREPNIIDPSLTIQNFPMLQDLPRPEPWQIGQKIRLCVSFVEPWEVPHKGKIQFIVFPAIPKITNMYFTTLKKLMLEYVNSLPKDVPYVPRKGELCVCVDEDGTPMRAEFVRVVNQNMALLSLIDLGYQIDVTYQKIYKITRDVMQLPPLSSFCYIEGIPVGTSHAMVSKALEEVEAICEAEVSSYDNEFYTIRIPELIARVCNM